MKFSHGTTISKALIKYLHIVGLDENVAENNEQFGFIYNAQKLDIHDNRLIENVFMGSTVPNIIVNDINNLIGA